MAERDASNRDVHGKSRLQPMTEIRARCAYGKVAMLLKKSALLAGGGFGTGGTRNHGGLAGFDLVLELVPQPGEGGSHCAGLPAGAVGDHGSKSRQRLGAARLRMLTCLAHHG